MTILVSSSGSRSICAVTGRPSVSLKRSRAFSRRFFAPTRWVSALYSSCWALPRSTIWRRPALNSSSISLRDVTWLWFYGILLSDAEMHHWQFMAIGNQDVDGASGVTLADLPTDEPIDPILQELGTDVSAIITHDSQLQKRFATEPVQFLLSKGPELDHVAEALGIKAGTLLAVPWQRPRGALL